MSAVTRVKARQRRKKRIRGNIRGSSERPRLCVFRSSRHIYAQIVDDSEGRTLAEASSMSKELRAKIEKGGGSKVGAAVVGSAIAEKALKNGIKKVVFDRNGFLYHGRVKAVSDAAREHGLEF